MIDMEQIIAEVESIEARKASLKEKFNALNEELDEINRRIGDLKGEYNGLISWERSLLYRYYTIAQEVYPGKVKLNELDYPFDD